MRWYPSERRKDAVEASAPGGSAATVRLLWTHARLEEVRLWTELAAFGRCRQQDERRRRSSLASVTCTTTMNLTHVAPQRVSVWEYFLCHKSCMSLLLRLLYSRDAEVICARLFWPSVRIVCFGARLAGGLHGVAA